MELINNLTFDNLLKNHQWTSQFNEEQLEELIDGYNNGIDVQAYADPQISEYIMYPIRQTIEEYGNPRDSMSFRKNVISYINEGYVLCQIIELVKGLLSDIDISLYDDPSLGSATMQIIRHNLTQGIDTSKYARQGFTSYQLVEIAAGLRHNLDVSCYANKDFTPQQMRLIRIGLEEGLDAAQYTDPALSECEMNRKLDELRHPIIIGGSHL